MNYRFQRGADRQFIRAADWQRNVAAPAGPFWVDCREAKLLAYPNNVTVPLPDNSWVHTHLDMATWVWRDLCLFGSGGDAYAFFSRYKGICEGLQLSNTDWTEGIGFKHYDLPTEAHYGRTWENAYPENGPIDPETGWPGGEILPCVADSNKNNAQNVFHQRVEAQTVDSLINGGYPSDWWGMNEVNGNGMTFLNMLVEGLATTGWSIWNGRLACTRGQARYVGTASSIPFFIGRVRMTNQYTQTLFGGEAWQWPCFRVDMVSRGTLPITGAWRAPAAGEGWAVAAGLTQVREQIVDVGWDDSGTGNPDLFLSKPFTNTAFGLNSIAPEFPSGLGSHAGMLPAAIGFGPGANETPQAIMQDMLFIVLNDTPAHYLAKRALGMSNPATPGVEGNFMFGAWYTYPPFTIIPNLPMTDESNW